MAQEAYCNMLVKYREELTRPIDEAMEFLKRVEAQLDSIAGAGAGSSAARLSLAGNEIEKPAGCCNSQLLLLASSRTWSYDGLMFFYYHSAIGLPHWEWLFWIVAVVALDHCHCDPLACFSVDYFNPHIIKYLIN